MNGDAMRWYKLGVFGLLLTGIVLAGFDGDCYAARLDDEEAADQVAAPDSGNKIQLNFRDVELLNVIRLMSELTGKNFLVDGNVRGKVTLIAPEPVSIDEAYQVFLSILEIQGFTVVPQGTVIKVIPSADIKDNPIPTATDGEGALSPTEQRRLCDAAHPTDVRGREPDSRAAVATGVKGKQPAVVRADEHADSHRDGVEHRAIEEDHRRPGRQGADEIFRVLPLQHADAGELASSLQTALQGLAETNTAAEGAQPSDQAERRRRRRQRSGQSPQTASDGADHHRRRGRTAWC